MPDLIKKKRDGGEFSREEINWIIDTVVGKQCDDLQLGEYIKTTSSKMKRIFSNLTSLCAYRALKRI